MVSLGYSYQLASCYYCILVSCRIVIKEKKQTDNHLSHKFLSEKSVNGAILHHCCYVCNRMHQISVQLTCCGNITYICLIHASLSSPDRKRDNRTPTAPSEFRTFETAHWQNVNSKQQNQTSGHTRAW